MSDSVELNGPEQYFMFEVIDADYHKNLIQGIVPDTVNVLFTGCSVTAGEALQQEDMYTNKIVKSMELLLNKKISADNVAVPGASVSRSIDQAFSYFKRYGHPDYLFLFLPDSDRDSSTVKDKAYIYFRLYSYLEAYCKLAGIKLFVATWAVNFNDVGEMLTPDGIKDRSKVPPKRGFDWDPNAYRPHWTQQIKNSIIFDVIFDKKDTYIKYTNEELTRAVFELDQKTKHPNSLLAEDGLHPGISFHTFWAELFMDAVRKDLA